MREKAPATINEQIKILKQRGCIIDDEKKARDTLKYINYYRLSNYFEPFSVSKHKYEDGTTFEKIMRVYEMDRKLRSVLLAALEEVEIALRAIPTRLCCPISLCEAGVPPTHRARFSQRAGRAQT